MRCTLLLSHLILSLMFLPAGKVSAQEQVVTPPVVVGREQKFSQDELDSLVRTEIQEGWQALGTPHAQNLCCVLSAQEVRVAQVAIEHAVEEMSVPVDAYMLVLERRTSDYQVELTPRYDEQEQVYSGRYWFPDTQFHNMAVYYVVISRDTFEVLDSGELVQ